MKLRKTQTKNSKRSKVKTQAQVMTKGLKMGLQNPAHEAKKIPKIYGNVFNDDKPYHMAENIKQAKGNE
jgi:hypothetical protein